MNKFFYSKLAYINLKKNSGLYTPYILTAVGMFCAFYILNAITRDEGLLQLQGGNDLKLILGFGSIVVGIFSTIFLFYTNSFLIKRRKKEFGLFNVLGMEKKHIGKIMLVESIYVSGICLVLGLFCGVILNKLMYLLLINLTGLIVPYGFQISMGAVITSLILFVCIFIVTLIYNLGQVKMANPIELLHSKNHGEKEPKSKWFVTIVGLITMSGGYYIAISTKNPIAAIFLFFVAVVLVMIGTYTLFTAGSITWLKMLKKKKKYFYKTKHFISISGMIYRMKQNAVGLANICILSTAVLVIITGTVSLYVGSKSFYPADANMEIEEISEEERPELIQLIQETVRNMGLEIKEITQFPFLHTRAQKRGESVEFLDTIDLDNPDMAKITFLTLDEYNRLTKKQEELSEDEIFVYVIKGDKKAKNIRIGDGNYKVKSYIDINNVTGISNVSLYNSYYFIVKDKKVIQNVMEIQKNESSFKSTNQSLNIYLNLTGTDDKKSECIKKIEERVNGYVNRNATDEDVANYVFVVDKYIYEEDLIVAYGGFLFLGILLGVVFIMATVLIIYYKQISEGYEDKQRFEIMKKVGLSKKEVRMSIRSQIIKVFFLPLITAVIHLAVAFPLITRLLSLFSMYDIMLTFICAVITVSIFVLIYWIIYMITAKVYYKIVSE